MPRLPMPPTNPEEREKNIREQYGALGRFVEAFELMVDEVRGVCIDRTWEAIIDATELEFDDKWRDRKKLLEIPFRHQNITAKPLWDMMRAILAEIFSKTDNPHHTEYDNYKSLLGFIEREYNHLSNKRNELLHGTWLIGYTSHEDPDSKKFRIRRFRTSADGLIEATELPQDVTELSGLTKRCDDCRMWIAEVDFLVRKSWPLTKHFKREDGKWLHRLLPTSDVWTTFPEKHS